MVHVMKSIPSVGSAFGQALGGVLGNQINRSQQREDQERQMQLQQRQQQMQQSRLMQELNAAEQLPNLAPEQRQQLGLLKAFSSNPNVAIELMKRQEALARANQQKQPTQYQEENLEQRKRHLQIQEQRLQQAKEKGHRQLPELISRYTGTYLKDLGIEPSDKIELDKFVQNAFETQDIPLQDALQQGVDVISRKKAIITEAPVIERPKRSPDEVSLAMDEMTDVLMNLRDQGVKSNKDLINIAKKGKWKKPEIDEMLKRVASGERKAAKKKTAESTGEKSKVKFDAKNPDHVASAKRALEEAGGDRTKANAILFEEFSK